MNFQDKWCHTFAYVALGVGSIALIAWCFGHEQLVLIVPAYSGMTYNTSLFFVLLSTAILLPSRLYGSSLPSYITLFLVVFVGLFSAATLAQNIFDVHLGLDQFFFDSTAYYPENPYPGRMSPQTLVSFIAASIALGALMLGVRAPKTISVCTFVMKVLAFYGMTMFLLFPEKPSMLSYLSSMSLLTALAFFMLAVALRCLVYKSCLYQGIEQQELFPAIQLMFRLTYSKKFMLIGLFFLIPLSFSSWYVLAYSQQEIESLQQKVTGLEVNTELFTLVTMVQKHRGMMHTYLKDHVSYRGYLSVYKQNIDRKLLSVRSMLVGKKNLGIFDRRMRLIATEWRGLRDRVNIADAHDSWQKYTDLIRGLNDLIHDVGRSSTLLYDSNPHSNELAQVLTLKLPALFESVGKLRGKGSAYLAGGDLNGKQLYALMALDSNMDILFNTVLNTLNGLERKGSKHEDMVDATSSFALAMEDVDETIDAITESGAEFRVPSHTFFALTTLALEKGLMLSDELAHYLKANYTERSNTYIKTRYLLASALLLALLLILYVFSAFYRSLVLVIESLSKKAEEMKAGNFGQKMLVETHDEMGEVVASFDMVADELVQAVAEAQDAAKVKGRFLATMSHEIRTPLNGVLGLTELVLDSNLNELQREQLQTVHASGEILLHILNDILDFSKMEAGQFELHKAPFLANDLLESVIKLYAQNAFAKGVGMVGAMLTEQRCYMVGDVGRLQQILMNVVSNAVKFTREGEVVIEVSVLEDDDSSMRMRFAVIDSGIGISPSNQKKLFSEFSQVDTSHAREYGGTGLGLSIAKKLLGMMESKIQVESKEGEGATFYFDVTLAKGEALAESERLHDEGLAGKRALIVGQEGAARHGLKAQLEAWNVQVQVASMPNQAMALLLEDEKQPYDVLLVDKQPSSEDALHLISRVRQEGRLENLKIMLLCGYAEVRSAHKDKEEQVDGFLRKPVYQSSLHYQLLRVLGLLDLACVNQQGETITLQRLERILLVEDVIVNQQVVLGMLRKIGFDRVDVANHGVEALDLFAKKSYDLVLMDIQMPEMDGYTATRKIRETNQEIPIVALTANAFGDDKSESQKSGMNDHLTKPITGEKLSAALQHWLPVAAQSFVEEGSEQRERVEEVLCIDEQVLRRLHQDMGAGIGMIMDAFVADLPSQLLAIEQAIEKLDAGVLRSQAHRLKGTSRSMGALKLGDLCANLEKMGANQDVRLAVAMKDQVRHEIEHVLQAFQAAWLDEIR